MTRPVTAAVVAADLVTAFGFVVAFNQLGTQSPVDATNVRSLVAAGIPQGSSPRTSSRAHRRL